MSKMMQLRMDEESTSLSKVDIENLFHFQKGCGPGSHIYFFDAQQVFLTENLCILFKPNTEICIDEEGEEYLIKWEVTIIFQDEHLCLTTYHNDDSIDTLLKVMEDAYKDWEYKYQTNFCQLLRERYKELSE